MVRNSDTAELSSVDSSTNRVSRRDGPVPVNKLGGHGGIKSQADWPSFETESQDVRTGDEVSLSAFSLHDTRHDSMLYAHGESGVVGGVFNYMNIIFGSGVIAMPYACK